jgi:hypothetical protein
MSALTAPGQGGAGGGPSPPGVLAIRIARAPVVQAGRDAWRSSANVRHSATAQVQAAGPFVLDGLPGTPLAGHSPWLGGGRAFGACCFAGKLQPCPARLWGGDPHVNGYVNPYVIPYALGVRTPGLGGQAERTRFARLIHRPGRVLGGPAVRAACGGDSTLAASPPRVSDAPTARVACAQC